MYTCRLCLTDEGTIDDIFSSKVMNFPQKVFEYTNVIIRKNQYLPNGLCEICKTEIISWLKFKRQVVNSNELLRSKYPLAFTDECDFINDKETQTEFVMTKDKGCGNETVLNRNNFKSSFGIYEGIRINSKINSYKQLVLELNLGAETDSQNDKIGDETFNIKFESNKVEPYQNVPIFVYNQVENSKEIKDTDELKSENECHPKVSSKLISEPNEKYINENINIKSQGINLSDDSNNETKNKTLSKWKAEVIKTFNGKRTIYSYKCHICGQTQTNIKQHMFIHSNELPYKCTFDGCDRAFRQKQNLKHHINTHTGTKPYKCKSNYCNKAFTDPSALRSHMVLHTGERNYQCDICNKSFGWVHTLAKHKKIHQESRERQYACTVCNKKFFSKDCLTKHSRIHSGHRTRPSYQCNLCQQKFRYNSVLKAHVEKDHMRFEVTNDIDKGLNDDDASESEREENDDENSLQEIEDENLRNFMLSL